MGKVLWSETKGDEEREEIRSCKTGEGASQRARTGAKKPVGKGWPRLRWRNHRRAEEKEDFSREFCSRNSRISKQERSRAMENALWCFIKSPSSEQILLQRHGWAPREICRSPQKSDFQSEIKQLLECTRTVSWALLVKQQTGSEDRVNMEVNYRSVSSSSGK